MNTNWTSGSHIEKSEGQIVPDFPVPNQWTPNLGQFGPETENREIEVHR